MIVLNLKNSILNHFYLEVKDEIVEGNFALLEKDRRKGGVVALQAAAQRNVNIRKKISGKQRKNSFINFNKFSQ
jgi:hypothetical protein